MFKVEIRPEHERWNVIIRRKQTVVFLQALQGSGKTTIAKTLCQDKPKWEYIEQDQFKGNTRKCQEALIKLLEAGTEIIIVSRCNINIQHYKKYLELVLGYCDAVFINLTDTKGQTKTPMTLARSIAGILNRSESTQEVVFGSELIPLDDAVKYTEQNMKFRSTHPKALNVPIFEHNEDLDLQLREHENLQDFVKENVQEIMALSRPLDETVKEINAFLCHIPKEHIVTLNDYKEQLLKKTFLVSFNLEKRDKKNLIALAKEHGEGDFKCEHVTQIFMFKGIRHDVKKLSFLDDIAVIEIDGLVINHENGMSAFHVKSIQSSSGNPIYIHSGCPHVTACVPNGCQPKDSLNFVAKRDDSVEFIPYETTLRATCRYMTRK
jgi:hypothetical protein